MNEKRDLTQVTLKDYKNFTLLSVTGQVHISRIGDFTSVVWRHFEDKHVKAIVVDATCMEAIDSTGLATLISVHQKVAPIFIFGLHESIDSMMDRVGLNRVFNIFKTLDELKQSKAFIDKTK